MHWFWRAVIAVILGALSGVRAGSVADTDIDGLLHYEFGQYVIVVVFIGALSSIAGVVAFGLLTRFLGPQAIDPETHCRKCGYILKGISEPRCSECGEVI